MCLVSSNVRSQGQWNWDGDFIVHSPIIPASRGVPGTRVRKYPVDIRSYLSSRENAVVGEALGAIADGLSDQARALFYSRKRGAFDFRMRKVTEYVANHIACRPDARTFDTWRFPEETLAIKGGDCEDQAFLLASMLLASGISGYVVRVAMGKLYRESVRNSRDHVWVMYKNESGRWMLVEPLLYTTTAGRAEKLSREPAVPPPAETYEYVPYFVFNDSHLWSLKSNTVGTDFLTYVRDREFWDHFTPEFAASVHDHILDDALAGKVGRSDLLYLKAVSLALDINPGVYDPRDHFDNGYVTESWQRLQEGLAAKTLDGLAHACHTAADLYAHTSYAHFGRREANGDLVLFDGVTVDDRFAPVPDYGSGAFDLHDTSRFTSNPGAGSPTLDQAIGYWNGRKLISGRFAQPGDPHQGLLEKLFVYIPYALRHQPDFPGRTMLPHHNEIAVDTDLDDKGAIPSGHKLYTDATAYSAQFKARRAAAVRHIQQLHQVWKASRGE